jgi:tetratricopeptide (TPR) repeat protein
MARDEKQRQKKLARKRAKRKTPLRSGRHEPATQRPERVQLISYEITDAPLSEPAFQRLPEPVKDQLNTLYNDVLLKKPKEALAILQPLIEQYPDVPQLYNYLHIAYQTLGDSDNAQRMLKETLARFPNYLFGRIAYATECLQRGETEKVPEIFNHQYELKRLYPKRQRFHISEVLGFYSVMAWYFHAQGESHRAETYYELMRQLDPEHRNTRFIKGLLYPSRLDTLLGGLLNKEP